MATTINAEQNIIAVLEMSSHRQSENKRVQKEQQKISRDLMIAQEDVATNAKAYNVEESGFIPLTPTQLLESQQLKDPQSWSIVVLLGNVMGILAKATSNYSSLMWNEASKGMNFAVNFAPLIAQAIVTSFNSQANQSDAESVMARNNAIVAGVSFGIAVGWGAVDAFKELNSETNTVEAQNRTTNPENAPVNNNAENDIEDDEVEEESDIEDAEDDVANNDNRPENAQNNGMEVEEQHDEEHEIEDIEETENRAARRNDDTQGPGTAAKNKASSLVSGLKFWGKVAAKGLAKSSEKAMLVQMQMQMGTNTNECVQKSKIANIQRTTGAAESASKEMEQFSQYWNQLFGRADGQTNSTQQFIDTLANTIQKMSDSVTSQVQQMIRG